MEIEWRVGAALRCAEVVQRSEEENSAWVGPGRSPKKSKTKNVLKRKEEICSAIRQRSTGRGEARRVFVMWKVLSCSNRYHRWRTKLHLGGRKSLDDYHRSSTLGAAPKIARVLDACGVLLHLWCRAEQLKAKRQESGTLPVGQEAEMPDAHVAVRKQVQQDAA